MVNGIAQITCKWCDAPCDDSQPWYSLLSICSQKSSAEFSWQLCQQCYKPIQRAIIGVMQQNLRTGIADVKQQAAGKI